MYHRASGGAFGNLKQWIKMPNTWSSQVYDIYSEVKNDDNIVTPGKFLHTFTVIVSIKGHKMRVLITPIENLTTVPFEPRLTSVKSVRKEKDDWIHRMVKSYNKYLDGYLAAKEYVGNIGKGFMNFINLFYDGGGGYPALDITCSQSFYLTPTNRPLRFEQSTILTYHRETGKCVYVTGCGIYEWMADVNQTIRNVYTYIVSQESVPALFFETNDSVYVLMNKVYPHPYDKAAALPTANPANQADITIAASANAAAYAAIQAKMKGKMPEHITGDLHHTLVIGRRRTCPITFVLYKYERRKYHIWLSHMTQRYLGYNTVPVNYMISLPFDPSAIPFYSIDLDRFRAFLKTLGQVKVPFHVSHHVNKFGKTVKTNIMVTGEFLFVWRTFQLLSKDAFSDIMWKHYGSTDVNVVMVLLDLSSCNPDDNDQKKVDSATDRLLENEEAYYKIIDYIFNHSQLRNLGSHFPKTVYATVVDKPTFPPEIPSLVL